MRVINWIVFPATLVIALLLLISGQAPLVSPGTSTTIALLGLGFPILFLLNFLLIFYWVFQLKWRTLIPVAVLLLNLGQASLYVQLNNGPSIETVQNEEFSGLDSVKTTNISTLKVITYNAGLFGYFQDDWNLDSVISVLERQKADVICLQEVYSKLGSMAALETEMSVRLNLPYSQYHLLNRNRPYGMLILSKYPIKKWEPIRFQGKTGNTAMWVDIQLKRDDEASGKVRKRLIRIYNLHLQSFRFGKKDYQYIEKQGQQDDGELDISGSMGILERLRKGYEKRSEQVGLIKDKFIGLEHAKIVCGDLNDVPVSYSYRELSKGMKDAFVEAGWGLETTYKGKFPSFRIDYIFCDGGLDVLEYESFSDVPSDHKMVTSVLRIPWE